MLGSLNLLLQALQGRRARWSRARALGWTSRPAPSPLGNSVFLTLSLPICEVGRIRRSLHRTDVRAK